LVDFVYNLTIASKNCSNSYHFVKKFYYYQKNSIQMKKIHWLLAAFSFMLFSAFLLPPKSIFDFSAKDIDEKEVSLSKYKGKVILVVNTASECGLTPQYEDLQKLYETYQSQGLEILAFPSNDFLKQEPGNNKKIKEFCSSKYNITFPLFAKIDVKGKNMHPIYKFLTKKSRKWAKRCARKLEFPKILAQSRG